MRGGHVSQLVAQVLKVEQLLASGKAQEALALAQRLLPKGPGDPGLNSLMSLVLLRLGRHEQAEYYALRAQGAEPGSAALMVNLAMVLQARRKQVEALAWLRCAVEAAPTDAKARLALANTLMDMHDAPAAAEHLRAALAQGPDAQVAVSYAGALLTMGYIEEVVEFTRGAIRAYPGEAMLVAGLPAALTYLYGVDPAEIASAHRAYGELMDRLKPDVRFEHAGSRDPARRLRVGLLSPDLRQHSVSFFIEPFMEHHDRAGIELLVYSGTRDPDRVTQRLRAHASVWRETADLSDLQLAERVNADRVDVLIELAGHTLGNNLPAMNLKPAPVQVTYCGYPDTTGLRSVDYRIVDSLTDPNTPGVNALATERLWRLDPCFLCYRPLADAPEPARVGAGPVFGSFNASRKINRGLIALWSRLLREVPGSRLVLKSFDFRSKGAAERIREGFEAEGVGAERLEFLAATATLAEHLALYSGMDVALDAFPYHGTTTTCEALWMGVPVVTLEGRTHAGRVGVSLLTNAGVPELIARSEDEYVSLAAGLARDHGRIEQYRRTLRGKMAASALCDPRGFCGRFEGAIRGMWRAYCGATAG